MSHLHLDFPLSIKSVSAAGEIEGFASTYDNVDRVGDRVARGAFAKTLAESGGRVPLLWQHRQDEPIGLARLSDSSAGLQLRSTLDLDVDTGRRAYSALKKGIVGSFSIGYDVEKAEKDRDGARLLTEIKLYEVSIVTIPANPAAVITAIKNDERLDGLREFRALVPRLGSHVNACAGQSS